MRGLREGAGTLPSVCCPITDSSRAEQGRAAHVGWAGLWGSSAYINNTLRWNVSQTEVNGTSAVTVVSLCTLTVSQNQRYCSLIAFMLSIRLFLFVVFSISDTYILLFAPRNVLSPVIWMMKLVYKKNGEIWHLFHDIYIIYPSLTQ